VVGEAVETTAQRDALIALGVDVLQGFCLFRPMTVNQLGVELQRLRAAKKP